MRCTQLMATAPLYYNAGPKDECERLCLVEHFISIELRHRRLLVLEVAGRHLDVKTFRGGKFVKVDADDNIRYLSICYVDSSFAP